MTIDYQALRDAAERAIPAMERLLMLPVDDDLLSEQELKDYGVDIDALNAFKFLTGPETVLALLDERERNQQYIKSRDQENEDIALTVGKLRVELEGKDSKIANLTAERDALREGEMGDARHSNTRAAADIYFQLVEECEIPAGGSLVEYVDDMREKLEAAENNLIDSECHVAELEEALRDKQALLEASDKRIAELEKSEEQLINERDHAESALADMYFAATGNRPEWSNWFGFSDAVDAVVDRIADLEAKQPSPVVPEEKPMPNPLSMLEREITQLIGDAQEATVTGYELIAEAWRLMDGQDPKTSDWHSNASKYLNSNIVEKVDDDRIEAVKAVLRRLAGNYPVTPDGWISCSERMPPQDDWILIYSKHGEYMAGQVQGEYVELSDGTLSWLGNALFWMPLPEPPQEVNRG